MRVAHELSRLGIPCVTFDFPGQGASIGTFEYGGYQHQVDDLQCVLDNLETRYNYSARTLLGHSMGGMWIDYMGYRYGCLALI